MIHYLRKLARSLRRLAWWRWDTQRKVAFTINMSMGIIVAVAFHFLVHRQFMEGLFNVTIDKMVQQETSTFLKSWQRCAGQGEASNACERVRARRAGNIAFIDVDSATFVKWGEPPLLPRDKIAQFLRVAEKNGAAVVALDVLLDQKSSNHQEDAELRRALVDLTNRRSNLKIIFPVTKSRVDNRVMKNIFDDLIDKNPNFHRSIPYLSASRTDRVVRYVRYYDVAKAKSGQKIVLWAVPILSTALFFDDMAKLKSLEPAILGERTKGNAGPYSIRFAHHDKVEISNNELFSNRIRFALLPPGALESEGNLFTERILPDELIPMQKLLKDRIVVIGSSDPDKEEWHPTPIGDMPGMYIIGNAINMLSAGWQIRDAPLWLGVLIQLFVISIAAYLFASFSPTAARVAVTLFAILLLIPVTYYFYASHGIFVNSVLLFVNSLIPVLAMGWHRILRIAKGLIIRKKTGD